MSCIRYVGGPCSSPSCLAEPLASCFSVCAEVSMLHLNCNPAPYGTGQQGYQSCPGKSQACRSHGLASAGVSRLAAHSNLICMQPNLQVAAEWPCCLANLKEQGCTLSHCLVPNRQQHPGQHRATSLTVPCIFPQASQQLQVPDFAALCQVCCLQGHQLYPHAAVQLQAASPVPEQLCLLHHSRPLTHCQHLQTIGAGRLVRLWPVPRWWGW